VSRILTPESGFVNQQLVMIDWILIWHDVELVDNVMA
jgi:hypothetical protein